MNTKYNFFFVLFFMLIKLVSAQDNETIKLVTDKTNFVAGTQITLAFKATKKENYKLYCANSYGATVLKATLENKNIIFKIPFYISNKKGVIHWKLIGINTLLKGQLYIVAKDSPKTIETYLGPPSIEAGGKDYTMLIAIPTDSLDNPLKQNTQVNIKQQFLSKEDTNLVFTKNLISYKNIYSPLKSGRMLLSSSSKNLNSKEFDVNIMPAIATNFNISMHRNHAYADGNQITTFYTSIIKDKNKNIISDGSFVDFFITNKKGNILKTSGNSINGIAHAKIIHPEIEDTWQVKAYVIGIAESDILKVSYKKVIKEINVTFSDTNRTIKIGPLKSFMGQMIPDGLKVRLIINQKNKIINELIKTSRNGFATFNLDANIYKNDSYDITIIVADISKTYKSKKLW